MTTQLQRFILAAVEEHGPLTFRETTQAIGGAYTWSEVHDAVRALQRAGSVVIFGDDRIRLTFVGRRTLVALTLGEAANA